MARARATSAADGPKEPHAVSLKGTTTWRTCKASQLMESSITVKPEMPRNVVHDPDYYRLSRPSLSYQYPLPTANSKISTQASLSYPSASTDDQFILSPNVCTREDTAMINDG
jgi:hypothetical protein